MLNFLIKKKVVDSKYEIYLDKNIPLKYSELYDESGDIGVIEDCSDICNIEVHFNNGGSGLYCLNDECKDTDDKLYKR
jgi:hypothetical protein